jgi:hypothetical protein
MIGKLLRAACLVLYLAASAHATAYVAQATGNWSTPATWTAGSGYPGSGGSTTDTVSIAGAYTVTIDGTAATTLNGGTLASISVSSITGNIVYNLSSTTCSIFISGSPGITSAQADVSGVFRVQSGYLSLSGNGSSGLIQQTGPGATVVQSGGTLSITSASGQGIVGNTSNGNGLLVSAGSCWINAPLTNGGTATACKVTGGTVTYTGNITPQGQQPALWVSGGWCFWNPNGSGLTQSSFANASPVAVSGGTLDQVSPVFCTGWYSNALGTYEGPIAVVGGSMVLSGTWTNSNNEGIWNQSGTVYFGTSTLPLQMTNSGKFVYVGAGGSLTSNPSYGTVTNSTATATIGAFGRTFTAGVVIPYGPTTQVNLSGGGSITSGTLTLAGNSSDIPGYGTSTSSGTLFSGGSNWGAATILSTCGTADLAGTTITPNYAAPAQANVYGAYGPSSGSTGSIQGSYSGGTAFPVSPGVVQSGVTIPSSAGGVVNGNYKGAGFNTDPGSVNVRTGTTYMILGTSSTGSFYSNRRRQ